MAIRALGRLVLCSLCPLAGAVFAQSSGSWADVSDPDQVRWLYTNKTHTGVIPGGTRYVGHFRADGKGVVIAGGQRYPRAWAVVGSQVCVSAASGKNCYTYKRNLQRPDEFAGALVGQDYVVVFTLTEGIPSF